MFSIVDVEPKGGVLCHIAQMGAICRQSHIRVDIALNIIVGTHVIAQGGSDFIVKQLSCQIVTAF